MNDLVDCLADVDILDDLTRELAAVASMPNGGNKPVEAHVQ